MTSSDSGVDTSSSPFQEYDIRFKTPFTCLLAGPTQSGKTSVIFNILRERHIMMDVPTDNIIYFYNRWQPSFTRFKEENIVTDWIGELPSIELLEEMTSPYKNGNGSIIVIDDFMTQLNSDISDLFTLLCHSNRISIFLLTQNVFSKNPFFRTISLNSQYVFIFKNSRDSSQITNYARQFAPTNTRWVVEAFRTCTKSAYSYMMFDHHNKTEEEVRVRSHMLRNEWPVRVWMLRGRS